MFYDVTQLSRIWNHPCILLLAKQRKEDKEDADDEEGSLKDFICDEEEEDDDSGNDGSEDSDIQVKSLITLLFSNCLELQELDGDGVAMINSPVRP